MSGFFYDLHLHSCLSPCGDPDMTPNNIVGMAKVKGLDVIALTDHNSCSNCPAAVAAGERLGVLVIPGMELCTSEDIHVVCLFSGLSGAEKFAREVYSVLPDIPNRPDIFGDQTVMDEEDQPVGTEKRLLINAAGISVNRVAEAVGRYGGAAFPAHIDKTANGICGILGTIPPEAGFRTAEISGACDAGDFLRRNSWLAGYSILRNSDAHYLWQISERENVLNLPDLTRASVITSITHQKNENL